MPSPFPGMDPYLENPAFWSGVHDRLIVHMGDVLQPLVPPGYYVDIGERIYFERPSEFRRPDLTVVESGPRSREPRRAGVATLEPDEPLIVAIELEVRETILEIRTVEEDDLVTALEVLSPTNKARHAHGREEYLNKRDQLLAGGAHVVEVDLLRQGPPVTLAPVENLRTKRRLDYVVSVSRASNRGRVEVYPFTLRDPLPRVKIPLRRPDPDIILDLPAAVSRVYDHGGYRERLRYHQPPPPPSLPSEDAEWMDALLRAHGLRGTPER
jgi:hypothetical protein